MTERELLSSALYAWRERLYWRWKKRHADRYVWPEYEEMRYRHEKLLEGL